MLKQFACDMDFYDDRDSAPSQEKTASAHSECTAHLGYLVFLFFFGGGGFVRLFGIVMGD